MTATIGELCAGYGGLGMGVSRVIDAEVAWYSEIDKGALKVLERRFPDVPNIGDMTTVNWSAVPAVDILTGGTPCQDLSHAGKRKGMTEGTRSNLWVAMREAVATLRPSLVIWENVGGAYSAEADSDLEPGEGRLGDRAGRPALRALGRVLGDLASLGYDAAWHGLRAADVGAPHGRLRVFVVAWDPHQPRLEGRRLSGEHPGERTARATGSEPTLLSTPQARDHKGVPGDGFNTANLARDVSLLPTPNPFHSGNNESPDEWRHRRLDVFQRTGTRHGPALSVVAWSIADGNPLDPAHYMPDDEGDDPCSSNPSARTAATTTPPTTCAPTASESTSKPSPPPSPTASAENLTTTDGSRNGSNATNSNPEHPTGSQPDWGVYGPAVHRWETLTRPAPEPTMASRKGTPQLAPQFSEWMMGLPAGWVTDIPGITRNEALRALGNGVVPQQAAAAVAFLLDVLSGERAA